MIRKMMNGSLVVILMSLLVARAVGAQGPTNRPTPARAAWTVTIHVCDNQSRDNCYSNFPICLTADVTGTEVIDCQESGEWVGWGGAGFSGDVPVADLYVHKSNVALAHSVIAYPIRDVEIINADVVRIPPTAGSHIVYFGVGFHQVYLPLIWQSRDNWVARADITR